MGTGYYRMSIGEDGNGNDKGFYLKYTNPGPNHASQALADAFSLHSARD